MTGQNNASPERKPIKRRVPEDKRPVGTRSGGKAAIGKGPVFWIVWLVIIIVVMIAWAFVLRMVSGLLAEYEDSQPKHVAERVFNDYFKAADYEYLIRNSEDTKITQFETIDSAVSSARALFGAEGGEWTFTQGSSDDPDVLNYSVAKGNVRVGSFTLVKSGKESAKLKLPIYTLGKTEIKLTPKYGANIYAPINANVKINGVALGEEFRYGDPVVLEEDVYFPEGDESARTMQNYFVNGLYLEPDVAVTSSDGSVTYTLKYDPQTVVWRADEDYVNRLVADYNHKIEEAKRLEAERIERENKEIRDNIGEYVVDAVKIYARWMQADASKAQRNKYFDTSSAFFKSLDKLISQSFIMDHNGYRFDDVTDGNYRYVEDDHTAVSAHVSFTQVLTDCVDKYGDRTPEWKNEIDVTVYLHLVDGKWLIYDIRND